jgi:pimeloyl-ACP methyl ester carboxylesterase
LAISSLVIPRAFVRFAPLLLLCLMTAGCASGPMVKLRQQPYNPLAERLKLTSRGGPKASSRTRQLLRRHDLPENVGLKIRPQLNAVADLHSQTPSRESTFALAELSYIAAKKTEMTRPQAAMELYFNSVAYSYSYLFDERFGSDHNRYDPRFRNACDLYNSSLESCLRIARKRGQLKPGHELEFTVAGRHFKVAIDPRSNNWRSEDFDSFEFVSDYDLKGLNNLYRTYGLGVPLIAVRKTGAAPQEIEQYYAPGLSFPVTAFLRLEPDSSGRGDVTTLRLELYDPLEATTVEIAGRQVPLESDISTPLAYFLDRPDFRYLDTFGLLRPDKAERIAGLYMVQPYQPGKIPVVMIHGLWSSPMTWIEAMNDLQSVPEIRENYQFWFYLYPTGQPFSQAAVRLRNDLDQVDAVFMARDGGSALRNKVLVGHSMGGLLAKLMTLESGDEFWNGVSQTPLANVNASPNANQQLQQIYYFEQNRTVGRVVTIAAPFRGSNFANNLTRWLAKQWITLPRRTLGVTKQILVRNPKLERDLENVAGMTSIDSLSPDSPFLQVMQDIPPPAEVPQHNIIGAIRDLPLDENTDGIVEYDSSHRSDVASEIVVNAAHSNIQRHPRTVLEIRRILLEHLADYNRGSATGIVPLSGRRPRFDRGNSPAFDVKSSPLKQRPQRGWTSATGHTAVGR